MIEITAIMKALSSLHLGTGKKSGTFARTLEHVPGRTIRGMVGYYLYTNDRELFDAMRIGEDEDMGRTGVFFKDALPLYQSDKGMLKRSVLAPSALKWCKKCGHLIDNEKEGCSNVENGKLCLQEGKKFTGFMSHDSLDILKLEKVSVATNISTKCPITRSGHTSPGSDFKLSPYHVESIVPGTSFEFKCLVEDEFADRLISTLKEAGIFAGIGGYRSRGYGTVAFSEFKEIPVSELIEQKASKISEIENVMLVANSPMIIRSGEKSIIGFDSSFEEYVNKTLAISGYSGTFSLSINAISGLEPLSRQRITRGIARGWSIKNGNKVSEIIKCIGPGSCVMVDGDPNVLAALGTYGAGEMINSGYGDVYFMEGTI